MSLKKICDFWIDAEECATKNCENETREECEAELNEDYSSSERKQLATCLTKNRGGRQGDDLWDVYDQCDEALETGGENAEEEPKSGGSFNCYGYDWFKPRPVSQLLKTPQLFTDVDSSGRPKGKCVVKTVRASDNRTKVIRAAGGTCNASPAARAKGYKKFYRDVDSNVGGRGCRCCVKGPDGVERCGAWNNSDNPC